MTSITSETSVAPIALGPDEGEALWFLGHVPHTLVVSSEQARFLLVTEPAGLEGFLRTVGQRAESLTIPPAPTGPPDIARLTAVAAEYGVEIVGPPGIPA